MRRVFEWMGKRKVTWTLITEANVVTNTCKENAHINMRDFQQQSRSLVQAGWLRKHLKVRSRVSFKGWCVLLLKQECHSFVFFCGVLDIWDGNIVHGCLGLKVTLIKMACHLTTVGRRLASCVCGPVAPLWWPSQTPPAPRPWSWRNTPGSQRHWCGWPCLCPLQT